jgi:hypothetical protein
VPEEEYEELALIYEAKGLSPEAARKVACEVMADTAHALGTLAREELGITPQKLGGSAWEAASVSFLLFATGAFVPVAPFPFLTGMPAVITSLTVSTVALFLIGAAITLLTGCKRVLLRAAAAAFRVSGRGLGLWHRPLARRNAGRLMPYMSTALGMLAPIAVKKVVLTIFRRIHEHGKPCKEKDQ